MMSGAFFCLLSAHSGIVAVTYVRFWCVFASQNPSKRCPLLRPFNLLALPPQSSCFAKRMVSSPKRYGFTVQNHTFYPAICMLLHRKTCGFIEPGVLCRFQCSVCHCHLSHGMPLSGHTLIGRRCESRKQFEVFCKSRARFEAHAFCYGLHGVCPIACRIVESATRFPNAEARKQGGEALSRLAVDGLRHISDV